MTVTVDLLKEFLLSIHLPNLLQGTCQSILWPLVPIICREADYGDAWVGILYGLIGAGRVVMNVPTQLVAHKIGLTNTLLLSLPVYLLGMCIPLYFWNLPAFMVGFVISGAGVGLLWSGRQPLLAVLVPQERRGRLMSLIGGAQRWSGVIGPLLGGAFVHVSNTRICLATQLPIGALAFSAMYVAHQTLNKASVKLQQKEEAARARQSPNGESGRVTLRESIAVLWEHRSQTLVLGIFSFTVVALRNVRRLILPIVALNLKMSSFEVGAVTALSYSIDALLFWVGGVVLDRFGRRWSAVPTALLAGLAYFALSFATTVPIFIFCVVFFGMAETVGAGLLLTLVADCTPPAAGTNAVGIMRTVQDSGILLGPVLMGLLLRFTDPRWTCLVFAASGVALAALAAVSSIFAGPVLEPSTPLLRPQPAAPSSAEGVINDDAVLTAAPDSDVVTSP